MIKQGYIRFLIDQKVYFEYYKLDKPDQTNYIRRRGKNINDITWEPEYLKALKEYEASKQLIEVSNVFWGKHTKIWKWDNHFVFNLKKVINNQPCEAELINNKATIIKLI